MLSWFTEPFSYIFMQKALLGVTLAGLNCSIIGVYVVLRRMSFLGGALAHTLLPGIVLAYIKGFSLFLGALGASILTALGVGWLSSRREVRSDTAIGVILSAMFALGVFMMSFILSFRDFGSILFGSVLGVTTPDLLLTGSVTLVIILAVCTLFKEFELSSYDPDYAQTIGIKPKFLQYILLLLIALSVVSAVQIVGALLSTALLITPAATAALIGRSVKQMIFLSCAYTLLAGFFGLVLSFHFQIASGASIVLVSSILFLLTWLIRAFVAWFSKKLKLNAIE